MIPLLLQMSWAAGTQCVAKGDHRKPKPGELAYQKGDFLTIVDTSTVLSCVKGVFVVSRCFPAFWHKLLIAVFFFSQKKGYYKARHNATGEEGLINSTKLREREALRVDPSLSLMPYVSSSSKFDALSLVRRITSVHMFTFSVTVTWKLFLTLAVGQSHLVTTQCWLVWDVQTNIVSGLITPTSLFLFCVCVNDRVLDDVFSCCLLKNLSL